MLWQPSLPEPYLKMTPAALAAAITQRKAQLSDQLVILGHHYQTDDTIQHADFTGDSLKLSQTAAHLVQARKGRVKYIIFCGVHFMAETADMLTPGDVAVILPDLSAGCSIADMAQYDDTVQAWEAIHESLAAQGWRGTMIPITYVNSSAAIKAFVGDHGGACCTSSNAKHVFEWAVAGGEGRARNTSDADIKVLFLPDQHLGRNTGFAMGIPLNEMVVWDPFQLQGGVSADRLRAAKVILWKGHCSVHQRFLPEHVDRVRATYPGIKVIVHPECRLEVCQKADDIGSTERLIKIVKDAPSGSMFAIGTEIHLINRVAKEVAPDKKVITLDDSGCLCTTMFRISPQHLCWALENLVEGNVVNRIQVSNEVKQWAKVALDRMLEIQ
jgi:quinolinate synthase